MDARFCSLQLSQFVNAVTMVNRIEGIAVQLASDRFAFFIRVAHIKYGVCMSRMANIVSIWSDLTYASGFAYSVVARGLFVWSF